MSNSNINIRDLQFGDGVADTFSYTSKIILPDELLVYVDGSKKVLGSDYTLTGVQSEVGGSVVFTNPPAAGSKIVFVRDTPRTQTTKFSNSGVSYSADTIERSLDKLTAVDQEQEDKLSRCLMLSLESTYSNPTIPDPLEGHTLIWNGSDLVNSQYPLDTIINNATTLLNNTVAEHAATVADANAILATTEAARDVAITQAGVATTQATNSATSAALANQWATSLALVDGVSYGAKKYAQDAAASVASVSLPGIIGNPLGLLRVKSDETGYELRSPSQVLADIGAASAGHGHTGVYEPANANIAKINVAQTFTTSQRGSITALVDGSTITPDFSLTNDFTVTLSGNRTIANPSNMVAGQKGVIVVRQDATGGRTVAWGSYFKWSGGVAPTLTSAANAVDRIQYHVVSATEIHCVWIGYFK